MSVHVLRTFLTRAKVYIGSFYIILVKQAMYKNCHTVRRVTCLNLGHPNKMFRFPSPRLL